MVTKRDLKAVSAESERWITLTNRAAWLLGPVVKLLYRIGPFRRWAKGTVGGRVGAISRLAESGRHEEAAALAMEPLEASRQLSQSWEWWFLARMAAENLAASKDREGMGRLMAMARDKAPPREGYAAAQALLAFSRCSYGEKEHDQAFAFAQQAADADPTWAEPNFVLGWYCLVLGRDGASNHLAKAVETEPEIYSRIGKDPVCGGHPHIIARLKRIVEEGAAG